ncbi:hypothetical protein D3C87_1692070 [compost metagenome]
MPHQPLPCRHQEIGRGGRRQMLAQGRGGNDAEALGQRGIGGVQRAEAHQPVEIGRGIGNFFAQCHGPDEMYIGQPLDPQRPFGSAAGRNDVEKGQPLRRRSAFEHRADIDIERESGVEQRINFGQQRFFEQALGRGFIAVRSHNGAHEFEGERHGAAVRPSQPRFRLVAARRPG